MDQSLQELGAKLVEDAMLREEFSAQRGLVNELFPFIYEASKRMSSRAISRWLEANGTKLSAATIAKALRNPEPYWQEILDEIEPAALIFQRAHNVDPKHFLANQQLFDGLSEKPPTVSALSPDVKFESYEEYQEACEKLRDDWFCLPDVAIETCLSSAEFGGKESFETREKRKGKTT